VSVSPVNITPEKESLFDRHKQRFTFGIPDTIYDFVPGGPASTPCGEVEISVYSEQRLVAASYFDIAEQSVSSIYAMFEPSESSRGLGIFTLLKEIETALELGKEFLYLGYCYEGKSFYDYKKRFRGTEMYNWRGTWRKSDLKV
jgi:arginine-tRNA-protein transferase